MKGLKSIGASSFRLLTILGAGGIFFIDLYFLTLNAAAILYICLFVFSLWLPSRQSSIILATLCTLLIGAGYWLKHGMYISPDELVTRIIAVTGIWSITIVATRRNNFLLQLEERERRIQTIIEEQTYEERNQFLKKTNALQAKLEQTNQELGEIHSTLSSERAQYRLQEEKAEASIRLIENERSNFASTAKQFFKVSDQFGGLPLTAKHRQDLESLFVAGESMLSSSRQMINRLIQIKGRATDEPHAFILRQVIETALDRVRYRAGQKNIGLSYFLDPGIPVTIVGDEASILQIFLDLLESGISCIDNGELTIVARSLDRDDAECSIRFDVHATGDILPDSLFSGWGNPDTESEPGNAQADLSTAIERGKRMGGTLLIDRDEKKGITAAIRLTVQNAPRQDIPLQGRPWFVGKHVLVVDRSDKVRRFLNHQLKNWGLQVTIFASGPEAARWSASGQSCDLGLVDLDLPILDGLTLAHQLKQRSPNQPIILMTAPGLSALQQDIATLSKPLKQRSLFELIENYLSNSKTTQKTSEIAN